MEGLFSKSRALPPLSDGRGASHQNSNLIIVARLGSIQILCHVCGRDLAGIGPAKPWKRPKSVQLANRMALGCIVVVIVKTVRRLAATAMLTFRRSSATGVGWGGGLI
jgi:hypothetical protein